MFLSGAAWFSLVLLGGQTQMGDGVKLATTYRTRSCTGRRLARGHALPRARREQERGDTLAIRRFGACNADGSYLDSHFVASFTRKLQGVGPSLALPLNWIEQQLAASGTSSNDLVLQENQRQAIDQVSVRNSIGTLRFIGATDWREFVETLSSVEQVLRQDKTGTYPLMDFATRDSYRHVVERISKSSDLSETEVAQKAIELSQQNKNDDLRFQKKRTCWLLFN